MICDAHIHFIPKELSVHTSFYKGVWTDRDKLKAHLDTHHIEEALLVYPSTDAHTKIGHEKTCRIYNETLKTLLTNDERFVCAGIINLENLSNAPEQVRILSETGFAAISIPSSYNGSFIIEELDEVFAAVQKYGMILFVHPQTTNPIGFERVQDPLLMPVLEYSFDISMFLGLCMMKGVFKRFDIKMVLSSLGGIMPFLTHRFDRVYPMLRSRNMVKDLKALPSEILKKVYVDTSGANLANIRLAIDSFGEDHIVWGSDYPVCPGVSANLATLDALGTKTKEDISYRNFKALVSSA